MHHSDLNSLDSAMEANPINFRVKFIKKLGELENTGSTSDDLKKNRFYQM